MCNTVSKGFWDGGSLVPGATIAGDESSATISVTKCEKDGEVYAERVPESKRGFKHLTEREDMVVSRDGHSLLH